MMMRLDLNDALGRMCPSLEFPFLSKVFDIEFIPT